MLEVNFQEREVYGFASHQQTFSELSGLLNISRALGILGGGAEAGFNSSQHLELLPTFFGLFSYSLSLLCQFLLQPEIHQRFNFHPAAARLLFY